MKRFFILLLASVALVSCGTGQKWAKGSVEHEKKFMRSVNLKKNGKARAPLFAPKEVKLAVAAANELTNKPYKYGGGHARLNDWGYDCSGSSSYVLRKAGLLQGNLTSNGFFNYGKRGKGDWITVYVRSGHAFLVIGGLRFDTGGTGGNGESGPRWKPQSRRVDGHAMRHPKGL
ncbi:peptidoglycan endopeptidase [Luteolibacter sp. AS25]|uniref:peptidoglycan endopeptidase n=1 Tax=Luteolibacter sp. AS25 TaxID=3135776 RepID=UPI00398B0CCE